MKESSEAKPIPTFRTKVINDINELPDQYSTTPGGSIYSTTPGGSRIKYERKFLMELKNSPLAKSPPKMAFIPGVTKIEQTPENNYYVKAITKDHHHHSHHRRPKESKMARDDQPQFDMDI